MEVEAMHSVVVTRALTWKTKLGTISPWQTILYLCAVKLYNQRQSTTSLEHPCMVEFGPSQRYSTTHQVEIAIQKTASKTNT
jgi:hypothetical protein